MRDLHSPFAGDLPAAEIDALAVTLQAVANPTRLRILNLIHVRGELTGVELQPLLNLTQPTVAHHLAVLDRAGLIRSRREGVYAFRDLDRDALAALAQLITPGGAR